MHEALKQYLASVESGLGGLRGGKRRLFLRELESHLLDEIEAKGLESEVEVAALLAVKESPDELAKVLFEQEDGDSQYRSETALLAGSLLGLATGGLLWLQYGWAWYQGLAFGIIHGLVVGTGMFLVRPFWRRPGVEGRVFLAAVFGTIMAIPLGFTSTKGFVMTRIYYGSYTGYLLERHSQSRPAWQLFGEVAAFTLFDAFMEVIVVQRMQTYDWVLESSFNMFLALAVMGVLFLRRFLSERRLFTAQSRR
nr:hypothetical protein [uncultured Holophaga sp.]